MRTKRLRRWVAGLCTAATLGIGALSAVEILFTTQDFTWQMSVVMVHAGSADSAA